MTTALIPYVPPIEAHGTHGSVTFCATTGRVLRASSWCRCGECRDGYSNIMRVDVAELRAFYAAHWPEGFDGMRHTDVLNIAWWERGIGYVPAAEDWRVDMLAVCRDGHDC